MPRRNGRRRGGGVPDDLAELRRAAEDGREEATKARGVGEPVRRNEGGGRTDTPVGRALPTSRRTGAPLLLTGEPAVRVREVIEGSRGLPGAADRPGRACGAPSGR